MFQESAALYDRIYGKVKNYADEAEKVRTLISKHRPEARSILDVACGTGEHARFLSSTYEVDGLDLNSSFVEIAQTKNPKGRFLVGDMANFDTGKKYDVIVCLFSSIGYVETIERLLQSIACFVRHLNEGGVIVLEPWFTPDTWLPGQINLSTVNDEDLKVSRMSLSETRDSRLSAFNFHYLVGSAEGVTHFVEEHRLGLFTRQEMEFGFTSNGLEVSYDPTGFIGRGLYLGKAAKPDAS